MKEQANKQMKKQMKKQTNELVTAPRACRRALGVGLLGLIGFLPSVVLACPAIDGTWFCKFSDSTTNTYFVESVQVSSHLKFKITDDANVVSEFVTDGVSRPVDYDNTTGTAKAYCENSEVVIENDLKGKGAMSGVSLLAKWRLSRTSEAQGAIEQLNQWQFAGQAPQVNRKSGDCRRP